MKKILKTLLPKVPVLKRVYKKYAAAVHQADLLEQENARLAQQSLSLRLQLKKLRNEPVHVVFVCHRPAIWESLHSVYDALKNDPMFQVSIVAIPNKAQLPKLGLNHEEYEYEGALEFWKEEGCLCGFCPETKEWLDLESLQPDYVFFQTPYNICRPPQYHSNVISKYAGLCYVSYFGSYHTDEIYDECAPLDYLKNLSFFFAQNTRDEVHITQRLSLAGPHFCKIINSGFPRYDRIDQYRTDFCDLWKQPDSFKIVWTPRWTTNEGNCHFFDYKDLIVDYCRDDPHVELVFRPHPQAFWEWNATGELPEKEADAYKQNFVDSNLHLDTSNSYYPTLYTSDCLITDKSSILLDYFCTGKPIIYCTKDLSLETLFPELLSGMYCVHTWEEVQQVLDSLRRGNDPLRQQRMDTLQSFFLSDTPANAKIVAALREGL